MFYLPYLLILSSALSFNQGDFSEIDDNCDDLRIDYRVINSDHSTPSGEIFLTIREVRYPVTFKLYDLKSGNYEFSHEKTYYTHPGDEVKVFDALKASDYVIQVVSGRCTTTLGGLEGIKVSRKQ